MACQTPLPPNSSSVSQRHTEFVPCAGVGQRVAECPTPLLLIDKSESVRARFNKAPRLSPLIFSGGIRTSGLEVLPKGALRCFQCNLVPSKGALKVLPKIAVAVPSKGALKVLSKIPIGNFSRGRRIGREHSRCCPMPMHTISGFPKCACKDCTSLNRSS